MSDYLWDRRDPPDPFVEALERRLAPLGEEVEALVDALDLEGDLEADQHEAMILSLPLASTRERGRGHWWILAAALALLASSVVVLARDQRRRVDGPALVASLGADRGDSVVSGRVQIGVLAVDGPDPLTAHAVLVALRDTHQDLARCALELEPGERIESSVMLGLDGGVSQITLDRGIRADRELATCIRAALLAWDASALGRADVELDLHLQHNQLEEQD